MKKYELTFPQRNIWMVENFYDSQLINIISGSFVIKRDFDLKKAEQMVNKFVELNEGMRLRIEVENNIPKQYVVPFTSFEADKKDISRMSEEEIEKFKDEYIAKSIDIIGGPLFSYLLLDRGNGLGEVFVKVHHIIGDAWTISKMGTAFSEIYEKLLNGEEYTETFPSYIDFIEAEQEYLNSEKYEKDNEFWKAYLEGASNPLGLKDSGMIKDTKAKRHTIVLDEKYQQMLDKYCKENRVSPYTVFLSALAIYLERVTEKADFIIGTPVLNRSNFKEKNMSGMFISTMPVRFKIDENETFLELVKRTGTESLTLFRHQKYPYLKISEIYKNIADTNDNMYKLILSYQNARASVAVPDKYELRWRFSSHIQDELEIHISDLNDTGRLEVHFDYLTSLFEDVEIEYLTNRILALIEDGITNNSKIETIKIMSDEEKDKILNEFNNTTRPYPKDKTIHEIFAELAKQMPDNIAVVYENKKLTYRELDDLSSKLGNLLRKNNVKPNECVAIMIDKDIELMVGILGILKSSAAYVPIDFTLPQDRIEYMLQNSGVKCIVTKRSIDNSKYKGVKIINIDLDEEFYNNESNIINNINSPTDMAYVMYTSGTTGKPKGAKMTHRNVIKLNKNITYIDIDLVDNIFLAGNIVFDASMHEMWLTYLNGKTGHVIDKDTLMNPNKYMKIISNTKNNLIIYTTQLFNQYSKLDLDNFKNTKYIIVGGDVLLYEYANIVVDKCKNTRLINIYGPTECTAATTTYWVKNSTNKNIPIGKPIDNTRCYVVDGKNRLLPMYVSGELYIGGEGVGLGYINNEETTKKAFINVDFNGIREQIYKSGDIVKWNNEGNIIFEGRKDRQIKIRGCRIELPEIENATLRYPGITQVNIKIDGKLQDKRINMYIVANQKIDINNLKEYLKDNIPSYMIPTGILQIEELPLNASGKVEQSKLPEIKVQNNIGINNIVLPKNEIEKIIFNEIENILGRQISIYDDIFDSGFDSILVTRLIVALENKGLLIKFSDVFKHRNISSIAKAYNDKDINSYMNVINEYNYAAIDNVLHTNYIYEKISNENIAITGATGFLGVHFLKEFLIKRKGIAYCLVRDSDTQGYIRLKNRFVYYFGNEEYERFKNRIKVLNYDIATEDFTTKFENDIVDYKIKAIINTAAIVKHYGNEKEFYGVNVSGVERLIDVSLKTDIRFIQVSTLSVSGNGIEGGVTVQKAENKVFSEKNLYIGQTINNLYTYTKYMAEIKVLEAINRGLKANIIRVGNLMGRRTDGKFQINAKENGFVQRLKFVLENQIVSKQIYKTNYLEFSPVDETASKMLEILDLRESIPVFHLYNDNHIMVFEFVKLMEDILNIKVKVLEDEKFTDKIRELNEDRYSILLMDINEQNKLDYTSNIKITQEFTKEKLAELNLLWEKIDKEYLNKFLKEIGEKKE